MILSAWVVGAICLAQPEPSAISAAQQFTEVHTSTPFADHAHVTFTNDVEETTTFDTLLRRGSFAGVVHAALELPGLRLHFAEQVLTAERTDPPNKAVVFRVTGSGDDFLEAISPHVPAMPMPELWRFDDEGRCNDPALGVMEVIDFESEHSLFTLRSQAGLVELRVDGESFRARALEAPLNDGTFHATYTTTDPGEVSTWTIPTAGRWIVTRLAQLTPPREPIEPGIELDDLNLISPAYQGWMLSEIQADERVRRSGPWVVLLMCRSDADEPVFELAGKVAADLWHAAAEEVAGRDDEDTGRYWFGHRSIVIAVSGELEILPEQMQAIAERSPRGVPLLVSTEPRRTIDRLRIPAPLTAVLIDPKRTVGAVVPIENAETGVSAIMSAMRSFVRTPDESGD